jgi:hypothetical protein
MNRLCALVLAVSMCSMFVSAQTSYMDEPGMPAFTTAFPVENGFINLPIGNLHFEIPIASYPQRGGRTMRVRLVYDSRIWVLRTDPITGAENWMPLGAWHIITDGEAGFANNSSSSKQCNCNRVDDQGKCIAPLYQTTYNSYFYQEPDGTRHAFNLELVKKDPGCGLSTLNGSAHSTDAGRQHSGRYCL